MRYLNSFYFVLVCVIFHLYIYSFFVVGWKVTVWYGQPHRTRVKVLLLLLLFIFMMIITLVLFPMTLSWFRIVTRNSHIKYLYSNVLGVHLSYSVKHIFLCIYKYYYKYDMWITLRDEIIRSCAVCGLSVAIAGWLDRCMCAAHIQYVDDNMQLMSSWNNSSPRHVFTLICDAMHV